MMLYPTRLFHGFKMPAVRSYIPHMLGGTPGTSARIAGALETIVQHQYPQAVKPPPGFKGFLYDLNSKLKFIEQFNPLLNLSTAVLSSAVSPYLANRFGQKTLTLHNKFQLQQKAANVAMGLSLVGGVFYARRWLMNQREALRLAGAVKPIALKDFRRVSFHDIKGYEKTKADIGDAVSYLQQHDPNDRNITMMVDGPPGTGKSDIATAMISKYIDEMPPKERAAILKVNASQLVSEPGVGAKKVDTLMAMIKKAKGDTVFIPVDEADSLGSRLLQADGSSEATKVINQLLPLIEGNMEKINKRVVWVFITNHKDRLDSAILDRAQMNIHVPLPNSSEQQEILRSHLRRNNLKPAPGGNLRAALDQCDGFSGRNLKNVALNIKRKLKGKPFYTQAQLLDAVQQVRGGESSPILNQAQAFRQTSNESQYAQLNQLGSSIQRLAQSNPEQLKHLRFLMDSYLTT